jgi:hypothetical protein
MLIMKTLFLNAVLALTLVSPALAGPALPKGAAFRGGSVGIPFTPCTIGAWWDGLCTEACNARICIFVGHLKMVCGDVVVFDIAWMEVFVEEDGKPPSQCSFWIGDLPRSGAYPDRTYTPRCGDGRIIVVGLGWNGNEPDIQSVSCIER